MAKKDQFENTYGKEVVSPPARLQFLHLVKPDEGGQYSDGKWKSHFLFDKEETEFGEMKAAIEDLSQLTFGCPAKEIEFVPFKNGDDQEWAGFPGSIYVVAKSKFPVDIWSPDKDQSGQIYKIDPKRLYPGAICRACFTPLAYTSRGKERGITFLLNFIQFLEDGPRFGGIGQKDARDIFTEYTPRASRTASDVTKATEPVAARSDTPSDPEAEEPAKRGRGRPAKTEAAPEASTEETPSQKARRLAQEQRASDDAAKGNGKSKDVDDLPIAQNKPKVKSSSSLMDMM